MLICDTYRLHEPLVASTPLHYLQQRDEIHPHRNISFTRSINNDISRHDFAMENITGIRSHSSRAINSVFGPQVVNLVIGSRAGKPRSGFYTKDKNIESEGYEYTYSNGRKVVKLRIPKPAAIPLDEIMRGLNVVSVRPIMSHVETPGTRRNIFLSEGSNQNDFRIQFAKSIEEGLLEDSNKINFDFLNLAGTQHSGKYAGLTHTRVLGGGGDFSYRKAHAACMNQGQFEQQNQITDKDSRSRRTGSAIDPYSKVADQFPNTIKSATKCNPLGKRDKRSIPETSQNGRVSGSPYKEQVQMEMLTSFGKLCSDMTENVQSADSAGHVASQQGSVGHFGEASSSDRSVKSEGKKNQPHPTTGSYTSAEEFSFEQDKRADVPEVNTTHMKTNSDKHSSVNSRSSHRRNSPSMIEVEDEEFAKLRSFLI